MSKTSKIRLSRSPRILLHRIENIRQYQQSLEQTSAHGEAITDTPKLKRAKRTQTKSKHRLDLFIYSKIIYNFYLE